MGLLDEDNTHIYARLKDVLLLCPSPDTKEDLAAHEQLSTRKHQEGGKVLMK